MTVRKSGNSLITVIALALVAIVVAYFAGRHASPSQRSYSQGPTLHALERLSELVVVRPQISDVVIGENDNLKGSWLVKGDALISVDLSKAIISDASTDSEHRRARITLPPPRVIFARVDHEKTQTWDVVKKRWFYRRLGEAELRDNSMKRAQQDIQDAAGSQENLKQAREQAELVITSFYSALDWDVKIVWQDE
jgi:hypothetical protein